MHMDKNIYQNIFHLLFELSLCNYLVLLTKTKKLVSNIIFWYK